MDPLTVASSILALIGAATKLSEVLTPFVSNMRDTRRLVDETLTEVNDIRVALISLDDLLSNPGVMFARRGALVQADHFAAVLTGAVITFNQLQALVVPLIPTEGSTFKIWSRIRWVRKEEQIARLIRRLERHKSSLILMLNVLQCESELEAIKCRSNLTNLVLEILNDDSMLLARLRSRGEEAADRHSLIRRIEATIIREEPEPTEKEPHVSTASSATEAECSASENAEEASLPSALSTALYGPKYFKCEDGDVLTQKPSMSSIESPISFRSDFEEELESSRVYKRSWHHHSCDHSFTSSAVRTAGWSIFSGLSLADISVISVMALPVYQYDFANDEKCDLRSSSELSTGTESDGATAGARRSRKNSQNSAIIEMAEEEKNAIALEQYASLVGFGLPTEAREALAKAAKDRSGQGPHIQTPKGRG